MPSSTTGPFSSQIGARWRRPTSCGVTAASIRRWRRLIHAETALPKTHAAARYIDAGQLKQALWIVPSSPLPVHDGCADVNVGPDPPTAVLQRPDAVVLPVRKLSTQGVPERPAPSCRRPQSRACGRRSSGHLKRDAHGENLIFCPRRAFDLRASAARPRPTRSRTSSCFPHWKRRRRTVRRS